MGSVAPLDADHNPLLKTRCHNPHIGISSRGARLLPCEPRASLPGTKKQPTLRAHLDTIQAQNDKILPKPLAKNHHFSYVLPLFVFHMGPLLRDHVGPRQWAFLYHASLTTASALDPGKKTGLKRSEKHSKARSPSRARTEINSLEVTILNAKIRPSAKSIILSEISLTTTTRFFPKSNAEAFHTMGGNLFERIGGNVTERRSAFAGFTRCSNTCSIITTSNV